MDTMRFRPCYWMELWGHWERPAGGGSHFLQAPCSLSPSGVQPFFLCGAHSFSQVFLKPPCLVSFSLMWVFGVQTGFPHLRRSTEESGKEWAQVEKVCARGVRFEQGCRWSAAGGTMRGAESSCRRGGGRARLLSGGCRAPGCWWLRTW